jgi:hypothetical protein
MVTHLPSNPWLRGLVAAFVTTVINVMIYAVGVSGDIIPEELLTNRGEAVTTGHIVIMSIAPIVIATAIYVGLQKFNKARANGIFAVISFVVFLLMLGSPFTLEASTNAQALFQLMHIAAALSAVGFLTGFHVNTEMEEPMKKSSGKKKK